MTRRQQWREIAAVWKALLLAAPIRLWALILAGPALTGLWAWAIWIIWRGGWPEKMAALQLQILGGLAFMMSIAVMIIVVSLAMVKVEAETKLGKFNISAFEDDEDAPGR